MQGHHRLLTKSSLAVSPPPPHSFLIYPVRLVFNIHHKLSMPFIVEARTLNAMRPKKHFRGLFPMLAFLPYSILLGILPTLLIPFARADASSPPKEHLVFNEKLLLHETGKPPLARSSEANNDFAILFWLQSSRTPEMEASTWQGLTLNLMVYNRALGLDLPGSAPQISAGITSFLNPLLEYVESLKVGFKRPRPYVLNPQLHPCLPYEKSGSFSFPSGHATWYWASAELLADLVPEKRDRLMSVANFQGTSRVLCGKHYPSDIKAGQRLGAAAAKQILSSNMWINFRNQVSVQKEITKMRNIALPNLPLLFQ